MKQKYNIKINSPKLSSEQIAGHQDFDALLKSFEAVESAPPPKEARIVKLRRYGIAAASIAAIMAAAYLTFIKVIVPAQLEQERLAMPFVNPPIEPVQPKFASTQVEATKGGVYEHPSGSKVIIPENAFVHKNGKAVFGEVELKYREYHDHVDFFLAGVPMQYDSSGVKYQLESAGMMEILAHQNGREVDIRKGKTLNVELASSIIGLNDGYNVYRLDTTNRNWEYMGEDNMELVLDPEAKENLEEYLEEQEPYQQLVSIDKEIRALELKEINELARIESEIPRPFAPKRPQKASGEKFVFDFDVDEAEFPEVAAYGKALWEVSDQNENFDERTAEIVWEDVDLEKLPNGLDYMVTLVKEETVLNLIVNPVLTGSDFSKALKEYQTRFRDYQRVLKEREEMLKEQKEMLVEKMQKEKDSVREERKQYEDAVADLKKTGLEQVLETKIDKMKVINRFKIHQTGVWNCDRPIIQPATVLAATFKDQNGEDFGRINTAYLVDKTKNTVAQFFTEKEEIRYDPASENIMWVMTKDRKMAIYRPEDFARIDPNNKEHDFVMTVIDKPLNGEVDIRQVLSFN